MTFRSLAVADPQVPAGPAVAASLLALAMLTGCDPSGTAAARKDGDSEPVAVPVEVAVPRIGDMEAVYTGTASITADRSAIVMPKVRGEVRAVLVQEGDKVRAGQVLARLDGDQLRLEAAQAEANLRKLERDHERNLELKKQGLVSVTAFDSLKYELDRARATYDLASLQLSYTAIRSPIDGIVVNRAAVMRVGNTVTPVGGVIQSADSAMFVISDFNSLVLNVSVPEGELEKLAVGQAAEVTVDAVPGRKFEAKIGLITPRVDPETGTFPVQIQVSDSQDQLRPGMFARVRIVWERKTGALKIPRSALLDNEGPPAVFVIVDGKAEQRQLELGLLNGSDVQVVSGVAPGDQVVVVGQNGLKNGTAVKVVNAGDGKQAAAR